MSEIPTSISRRAAIARLSAMGSTLTMLGCVYPSAPSPGVSDAQWPRLQLPVVTAPGYGTDPDLIFPSVPWPNILSPGELEMLTQVGEVLLPGATRAGVPQVLSEWLSAPYPNQQADRQLIQPGLVWMAARHAAGSSVQALVGQLIERADSGEPGDVSVQYMARLRSLVTGAYFSSPEGVAELGYSGNQPILGEYPGPSAAAQAHLEQLLQSLQLTDQQGSI